MKRIAVALAILLGCISLVAQTPENTQQQKTVSSVVLVDSLLNNQTFSFYVMSVTMPNSHPKQVYTGSCMTLKGNVLNGSLPLFTRDRSAKEYRDFEAENLTVTDYSCKFKKGIWTIKFNIQKGPIPYSLKYTIDGDGVAVLALTNNKTKTTILYDGRIRAPREKKNKSNK
ncbi:MAG: DUF4251 domain-containing protein [Paludibacteraceae bacterium]|nr:DUF4251 domain-containing protein [Paludibacteraceae bacterium]